MSGRLLPVLKFRFPEAFARSLETLLAHQPNMTGL